IYKESMRLTRLLDEILDLSALERGERDWDNVSFDPEAQIDRAVDVCSALARRRSMRIVMRERAGKVAVLGDADRLCQVLINLISNAIKYNNADDPVVEVRSGVGRNRYLIEVSDNGPGIPKSERRTIFEKFTRGQSGAATGLPGAGLGLAISRQIVSRMNGKLELLSGPGSGARFRITLQLA